MQQRGIPQKKQNITNFSNAVIETSKYPIKTKNPKLIATKLGVKIGFDL
jgi:uncharacterized protein YozE (UPF0346 family)